MGSLVFVEPRRLPMGVARIGMATFVWARVGLRARIFLQRDMLFSFVCVRFNLVLFYLASSKHRVWRPASRGWEAARGPPNAGLFKEIFRFLPHTSCTTALGGEGSLFKEMGRDVP